ncbi:pentatricopeptide repeat (PPR-like) superfamily protein [Actinidia rufa]|uniref:Pentatricopeptide repeat (PPR-like) superfamily protein n=1 Tax=Actinidia rufa TaxID=165716 RepID=A0A7J0GK53_9ERIC|nr:pentatricopeptide repeat (PPR-like) superfamily protein [Actinidia rufa]
MLLRCCLSLSLYSQSTTSRQPANQPSPMQQTNSRAVEARPGRPRPQTVRRNDSKRRRHLEHHDFWVLSERSIGRGRVFFDTFTGKNVRTWTAMLTGEMLRRGIQLLLGICRCGLMGEARELFDQMLERNPVSWMVMISGYAEINGFNEAWDVFVRMHRSDFRPDQSIFVVAISAVTGLNDFELIGNLRTLVMKTGHERDVVVGTAILNVYARSGCLNDAVQFFELMPERNEYSWTSMIATFSQCERFNDAIALYNRVPKKGVSTQTAIMTAYAQSGRIEEARRIFNEIPTPYVIAWNAMVAGYAQNGMLEEAKALFLQMPIRNSASWAAMIAGLVHNGRSKEALELLAELHRSGAVPSHSSFTSALSACANNGAIEMAGYGEVALQLFLDMNAHGIRPNELTVTSILGNSLVTMYFKCGFEYGFTVFEEMGEQDIVTWNAILAGCAQNGFGNEAVKIFEKMKAKGVAPDQVVYGPEMLLNGGWPNIIKSTRQSSVQVATLWSSMIAYRMHPMSSCQTLD